MGNKIISSTRLRDHLADVMNEAEKRKSFFIITKKGLPKSAIVDIDLFEDLLSLANKDFVKSIKKAREEARKGDVFSHEDVFGEL